MKAVVTGGAGFIGSHLVRELRARRWDVEVIDPVVNTRMQKVPRLAQQPDAIFHLASPVGPVGVLSWAGRLVPEVLGCAIVAAAWARDADCPLVNVSTSEVYGSGSDDHETDPCVFAPATSARKEYAVAKLAAETMLRNTRGLDVRIVRPFNVAGPGQKVDGGFVIPRFVVQALADEPLTVYQPGTQQRAFTHVLDIVDGLMLTLERGEPGEVYNLGNPANLCPMLALASEVILETGSDSRIDLVDPTTIHGPAFREAPDKIPNAAKAARELGWQPTRTRLDIIRDAIASVLVPA